MTATSLSAQPSVADQPTNFLQQSPVIIIISSSSSPTSWRTTQPGDQGGQIDQCGRCRRRTTMLPHIRIFSGREINVTPLPDHTMTMLPAEQFKRSVHYRNGLMVADEIIARADGPDGLKALNAKAAAAKAESAPQEEAKSGKKKMKIPFFASA